MKKIIRLYKVPILVTALLLAGVFLWGWHEWKYAQTLYKENLKGAGKAVVESLEGVIDSLNKYSPYNLGHLRIILEGVIRASGLRFAVIQQSGTMIVEAGDVPYDFAIGTRTGDAISEGCFTAWKPIELKDTFEYYSKDTGETPILAVGLPMDRFFNEHLRSLRELWIKLTIGFIGILSAGIIWVLSIHARLLASELDVTKIQKDHFEELGMASAGLAHESKNPLGIIRGLAQRISRETEGNDDVRKMSEQIMDEVDRTSARLGEFMSYAKNREPEITQVVPVELIENIKNILAPDLERNNITLKIEGEKTAVRADEEMFRQVIINLLLNSLKASQENTEIRIRILREKKEVTVEVADQGCGISPGIIDDIFKPYVTGREGGHGLGLAIVHRIAGQHGWRVEAESEAGRGTTVRISGIQVSE